MVTQISPKEAQELLKGTEAQLKEFQNPECNQEGHFCGCFRGTDACIIPNLVKNPDGTYTLFDLKPCRKTGLEGFEVNE